MWKDLKNSNKSTTYGLDSTIWPLKFGALTFQILMDPQGLLEQRRFRMCSLRSKQLVNDVDLSL